MPDLRTTLRLLRLLLSEHNLQITGLHEQMIEQLGSISPSKSSATGTRNADASASATKRLRPKRQEPAESDVYYERTSYLAIKVYLATVKNLHTEFGFPLDFTSMPLLHKTVQGISKRACGLNLSM